MKLIRGTLYSLGFILLIGSLIFFFVAAKQIDKQMNGLYKGPLPAVSPEAKALHAKLIIADWHSDNLLWDRDPLERLDHGHVDIPRLIDGNVSLQVFDAVIKTPRGQNYTSNNAQSDNITLLAMANRWPIRTWASLYERAIYQSEFLHKTEKRSKGRLSIIKDQNDLEQLLNQRKENTNQVGGLLSIEGLHVLEGKIENLDRLYKAGYRLMGLTHFFDNKVGGSSAGIQKGGLTKFGQEVIQAMNKKGIMIDLAHASSALIADVLTLSTKPVIISHTGVKGTKAGNRNLSDAEIKGIAEKGGLIGIGFWEGAVGGIEPQYIVKAIKHVVSLVGVDHVSLGSDYDGGTFVYFDSANLVVLTDALLKAGFSEADIYKIMGGNQIKFLQKYLPE